MSRIRIELPTVLSFITIIPIRITDLNYGGHVGNDTILSLIHEARVQFLRAHHLSELHFEGMSLIMSDVAIEFKNEIFYGDQVNAAVEAVNFSKVSFDIYYKFEVVRDGSIKVVAVAKTGMVCYDYNRKKVAAIPEAAIFKFKSES